jgi:exoribonuclease II
MNIHIEHVYVYMNGEEQLEFDFDELNKKLSETMKELGIAEEDVSDDLFDQYLEARRGQDE